MAVERQVFCKNPSLDCLNLNKAGDSPSSIYNWHCVLELERGLSNLTLKDLSTMQWKQNDWQKNLVHYNNYYFLYPTNVIWRKIMRISFRIDFPNSEETKWYWIQMVVLPMLYCTAEMQIGLVTLEFTYQILAMALQLLDGAF